MRGLRGAAIACWATMAITAGCTRPSTQLVGVVASDLPVDALVCSSTRVSRFDGTTVDPGDRRMFPPGVRPTFSFGVTPPGGDPHGRVEITVEAWSSCDDPPPGATPRAARTVRTGFLAQQTLRVDFFLSQRCLDVVCPDGSTCDPGAGSCVPTPEVAPESLTPVRPGEELLDASRPDAAAAVDTGRPRGLDAGAVDAGPAGPIAETLTARWILEPYETSEVDPLTRISAMVRVGTGVMIAGVATRAADFGDSATTAQPISTGGATVWLARIEPDGSFGWVRHFAGTGRVDGLDVVGDHVVATGTFLGSLDFAPGAITAASTQDAFAASFDPVDGTTAWAMSFGNDAGNDSANGAAGTDAGVLVISRSAMSGALQVNGVAPATLEGPSSAPAMALVLDAGTGAVSRAIALSADAIGNVVVRGDGAAGAIVALAGTGRISGLLPVVPGGGGAQLAVGRLDASLGWQWVTHLEGCTDVGSVRVGRAAGAVWAAFAGSGCGALQSTLTDGGGSRAGDAIPTDASPEQLIALALEASDGAPRTGSARAVTLYATGGYVGSLTVDGSDDAYVGGWIGLPSAGAMLDFGNGAELFTRNTSGTVQSNGAAFVWSLGPDGSYRGVDSWSFGGAGAISGLSDCITGLALDGTSLYVGGWLHNLGILSGDFVGGGFGYDIAVLFRTP